MIPQIIELNFPIGLDGVRYATLTKATVKLDDMGEKTITSEVSIDGQVAPDFSYDWEVLFKGEKYIMPLRKPQASKANDSLKSKINLTFKHWAQYQLQRWYFFTLPSDNAGVAVAEKYNASVSLHLGDFCNMFAKMLEYYYGDKITIDLNPDWEYSEEPTFIDINYSYMWDVLIKLYELYEVRWEIVPDVAYDDYEHYVIKVGYDTPEMDHIFEYGFEGGLLKVERQVQNDNIRNMLMGRGAEKNLPYRYFKNVDPDNPSFPADPDWVTELANVYFDRLRSAEFRSYVQGWKCARVLNFNEYKDPETNKVEKNSRVVWKDDSKVPWAWEMGYEEGLKEDGKFNPIEFVKDDDSIAKYGELMGKLEDNEEIFPSIQGVERDPYGRIDEAVEIEQVENDVPDVTDLMDSSFTLENRIVFKKDLSLGEFVLINSAETKELVLDVGEFKVPPGRYGNVNHGTLGLVYSGKSLGLSDKDVSAYIKEVGPLIVPADSFSFVVVDDTGKEHEPQGIPGGSYTLRFKREVSNTTSRGKPVYVKLVSDGAYVDIGTYDYDAASRGKGKTFDIWIKNIWETEIEEDEDALAYAHRVWDDILGDHLGSDAAVAFSTGWLSTSEDYEFRMIGLPVYDTSKSLNGVFSHWRLTLERSNADYDTLGKYVPNLERQGKAGDKFFFVGINLTQYYVEWAEERLHNYKLDQLEKIKDIQPSWVVGLDKVRIGTRQYDDVAALIDQLHIGGSIRLADHRFITEEGQADIPLYIQSITYKFNEGNTANLTPNVEVTLGTEYVTSANPVTTVQGQVDALSRQYASISTSNLQQIVRMVGDRLYLRKDGITDRSYSKTYFSDLLAALGFRQGMVGGKGWGFFQDENGKWVLETDRLNVRDEMQVNDLVINQIQARGGMIIESAASMEVTFVEERANTWRCYFDIKGGTVGNLFVEHDIAYCHRYDVDNSDLKLYKAEIVSMDVEYIEISKTNKYGTGIPEVGDVIVQYGNTSEAHKDRQFVIVRDMIGGGYERMLSGLNSVTAQGVEYFFAGYQSSSGERLFIGNDTNYLLYQDGKLTISGVLSVVTDLGNVPINEYIESFIPDINLDDWEYLRKALNNGETIATGGLVLTNLIMLGTGNVSDRTFEVYSGINGQPDTKAKGMGIAAWYGGDMNDGEPSKWYQPNPDKPVRYANSLFRFDGSGYLAGGNISWSNDGSGKLAGGNITFEADGTLQLNNGLRLQGGEEGVTGTIESLVNTLNKFTTNLVPVYNKSGDTCTWAEINGTTRPLYAIKSKVGFYSDSFISAMGLNPNEFEGVTYLSQLNDVELSNLTAGQALVWNGNKWENRTITSGGGGGGVEIVQTITQDVDKVPSANAVYTALANNKIENIIRYSQLRQFLSTNYATLATLGSSHVYQIYGDTNNLGLMFIVGDSNRTTLSLLLFTKQQVVGNQISNTAQTDTPKLYRSTYVYASGLFDDWKEIGAGGSGGDANVDDLKYWLGLEGDDARTWYDGHTLTTILNNLRSLLGASDWNTTSFEGEDIKTWLNVLRLWTGMPSFDAGEWEDGSLYEQMQRIVMPVDSVVYRNLTDSGTIGKSAWEEGNRYQVYLNMSDNRIYLYDAAMGRYYSKWNGYERWKPSNGEYYEKGVYVCFREAQIVVYDRAQGEFRIIAGSMFMKSLDHQTPSHTRLDQLSIPYMDEEAQTADTLVMSIAELKNLIDGGVSGDVNIVEIKLVENETNSLYLESATNTQAIIDALDSDSSNTIVLVTFPYSYDGTITKVADVVRLGHINILTVSHSNTLYTITLGPTVEESDVSTNDNSIMIDAPSDLLVPNVEYFSGKAVRNESLGNIGLVKAFSASGYTTVMLETMLLINGGDRFVNADPSTLRTYYAKRNSEGVWSPWLLLKEEQLP